MTTETPADQLEVPRAAKAELMAVLLGWHRERSTTDHIRVIAAPVLAAQLRALVARGASWDDMRDLADQLDGGAE